MRMEREVRRKPRQDREVKPVDAVQRSAKRRSRPDDAFDWPSLYAPSSSAVDPNATQVDTRIRRSALAVTPATAAPSTSKIDKRENFAGQTTPDNPVKPEHTPIDLDDEEEVEDEAEETTEKEELSESTVDLSGVHAVVRTGSAPGSRVKRREVKPTATPPTVNNNAGGSDCTPADFTSGDLSWTVVDKGKKGWGVQVTGLRTTGHINVNPTPNQPNSKTAPNTPNPVDGGNIEDNKGSDADWREVLKSLKGYHTKNGGRGDWHDTAASTAHEWAHWDTDWMKNCVGTTWPKYRKKMERLRVSKADYATATDAKAALEPKVDLKLDAFDSAATKKWNKVPDEPGDFFANGYLAGEKVLKKHIDKVEKYATKKRWNLLGKVQEALTPGKGGAAAGVAAVNP